MIVLLVRSVMIYLWIVVSVRLMGKRQIGQLQVSEFVVTIMISELAALPIIEEGTPLLRVLAPIALLSAFEIAAAALPVVFPKLSRFIDGTPSFLINHGQVDRGEMRRQRITMLDICEAMRGEGLSDIGEVGAVVLETNGRLSVLPKAEHAPATAGQVLRHVDEACGVPVIVVMDGAPHDGGLRFYGHDRGWLEARLRERGVSVRDVFFMSVDEDGQIRTILRRDTKE